MQHDAKLIAESQMVRSRRTYTRKHDHAEIAKNLISMARNGDPRPKQIDGISGKFLSIMTCEKHPYYDAQTDATLRAIRPEWFKKSKHASASRKTKLLELARSGAPRPTTDKGYGDRYGRTYDVLGNALSHYLSPNCLSYDEAFATEIYALRPDWFPKGRRELTKKEFLELARSGGARPSRSRLDNYCQKGSGSYDAEFAAELRQLRPDWFWTETDRLKAELLKLASDGGPRPSAKNTGLILYRAFRRYTRENEKPDAALIAELQTIRPDWFGPLTRAWDGNGGWTLTGGLMRKRQ
jgi:hypothetical protein